MAFISKLDTPLLKLSAKGDVFTLRDACAGVHAFGAQGSGKTSGTGQALAGAYLRAGMGALVLCAKPEEVELWKAYARKHGRAESVVIFDERRGFNFIAYELARQGAEGISNVIECLMRVLESADQASGAAGGKPSDPFWEQATRQVLSYCLPALYAAYGTVSVANIIDFAVSAAPKAEQYNDPEWAQHSYAARTLRKAVDAPAVPMDEYAQRSMLEYWFQQYPVIPEKTRGNIQISLSTKLDRFKHGRLRKCFCDRTDIVPEMTFHGAIIVMAMPALTWNEDGIIGQQLFKFMWQRAVESRNGLPAPHRVRPVFLWADESQYFVSVKDEEFLSICRASLACVVFMTQTLPTYYARLGKDSTDSVDSLVGKFVTQVFHQGACHRTNTFASQLIGRGLQQRASSSRSVGTNTSRGMNSGANTGSGTSWNSSNSSGGSSSSGGGGNHSAGNSWGDNIGQGTNESETWGSSEQMDFLIEPNYFAINLKSGGPSNGYEVTGVWFKAGGHFKAADGGNVLFPTFRQRP